jgi:hypothetical protein
VFEGLLRDEPRRGAIVLVGVVDPESAEPDLAVAEAEDRRVRELAIGIGRVLVTGAVDVQLLPLNEPLGMRQDHAPRDERPEAELVGSVDHAHPSHGPTPMGQTELSRNQQKVALLLFADHLERDGCPLGEPQVLRAECAFAVVVESAGFADQVKDLLDCLVVRGRNLLPPRNDVPTFRASGQSRELLGTRQHRTGVQTVEVLGELHELFADWLHGVPLRIAVVRLHLFVGEKRTRRDERCRGHFLGLDDGLQVLGDETRVERAFHEAALDFPHAAGNRSESVVCDDVSRHGEPPFDLRDSPSLLRPASTEVSALGIKALRPVRLPHKK